MAKKHSATIRIYNRSKQMIPLQVRPPGSDFFSNEQQVRIAPGEDVTLPKSYLLPEQIENLTRRRLLTVTFDSEAVAKG